MNASCTRSMSSNDCTSTVRPRAANSVATLPSVVVPATTHTTAPSMSSMLGEAAVGGDHHLLAVVERRVQERGAVVAVAARRPRRVAHEDVDLAGLQGREPGVGGDGDELDLRRVAEHGGRDDAAEVGVEADVLAGVVDDGEPGEVVAHTARERRRWPARCRAAIRPVCTSSAAVGRRRAGGRAAPSSCRPRCRRWPRCRRRPASGATLVGAPSRCAAVVVVVGAARGDQGDRRQIGARVRMNERRMKSPHVEMQCPQRGP